MTDAKIPTRLRQALLKFEQAYLEVKFEIERLEQQTAPQQPSHPAYNDIMSYSCAYAVIDKRGSNPPLRTILVGPTLADGSLPKNWEKALEKHSKDAGEVILDQVSEGARKPRSWVEPGKVIEFIFLVEEVTDETENETVEPFKNFQLPDEVTQLPSKL